METVNKLRQRLIVAPKPGTSPRSVMPHESITIWMGGDPKAGDDAGLRSVPFSSQVQEHIYVVDPLCDEAAKEIERLRGALEMLLPGLILDLRYADVDDDKDAMRSRIETVQEALIGKDAVSASPNEGKT